MNTAVHFSSAKDDWATPQDFFDKLDAEFGFTLDAAASEENAKCDLYYTKETDALSPSCCWRGVVWLNPPYGRGIGKWVKKAYEERDARNSTVVCLVPARTDTRWWHDWAMRGEIRFIKGRLKFGGHKNSAPFPSALVIFRSVES